MKMKYFTADLHFDHPFVTALRGFTTDGTTADELRAMPVMERYRHVDVDAHDNTILDNLMRIGKEDELWVLGDVASGNAASRAKAIRLLDRLNVPRSHRHLILGNHESGMHPNATAMCDWARVFGEIAVGGVTMLADGTPVTLSHFPLYESFFDRTVPDGCAPNSVDPEWLEYALPRLGRWHLHGHTHAKTPFEFPDDDQINVGVDAWDLKPVPESTLLYRRGTRCFV